MPAEMDERTQAALEDGWAMFGGARHPEDPDRGVFRGGFLVGVKHGCGEKQARLTEATVDALVDLRETEAKLAQLLSAAARVVDDPSILPHLKEALAAAIKAAKGGDGDAAPGQ